MHKKWIMLMDYLENREWGGKGLSKSSPVPLTDGSGHAVCSAASVARDAKDQNVAVTRTFDISMRRAGSSLPMHASECRLSSSTDAGAARR